jgi:glycine dehydrogenase subunit 1
MKDDRGHPYIPNSAPASRAGMLEAIGAGCIEDLFTSIPEAT